MKRVVNDKIRGCLFGGAVGDALGYPVEFWDEDSIFSRYGEDGIQEYKLDSASGKALISDDTQMTLFTANGLLIEETRQATRGIAAAPSDYIVGSYQDWLRTQEMSFAESRRQMHEPYEQYRRGCVCNISWLLDVPELYNRRAPGNTCLSALQRQKAGESPVEEFIDNPQNDSKGCGGVMRVAPLGLLPYNARQSENAVHEGAQVAAITHGHSLGYMTAAVLVHIINRVVYPVKEMTLKEIVFEARDTAAKLFAGDGHLRELTHIIGLAVRLSENGDDDLTNIHRLGEGWVAEETLGIAIYCALRHQTDFSAGVIAAVNHRGDSDSTGAVTGNILGALCGYEAIEEKWKTDLELADVILEMADDLYKHKPCVLEDDAIPLDWHRKYMEMRWKEKADD